MKIEAYIICWNEARILPWVLAYWDHAGIDKLVVYDNHSDDETIDILHDAERFYHYQIEIRPYDSGGHADDRIYQEIKNTCWKDSHADWVFVGDTDEVIYTARPLKEVLADEQFADISIIQPCGFQLVSWNMPAPNMDCYFVHMCHDVRLQLLGPNKTNLFRPDRVAAMNYQMGAHQCNPVHQDRREYISDISWFHLKNLGVQYLLDRNRELYDRLPDKVKAEKRIATHYLPGTDIYNVARDLAAMWTDAKPATEFNL